MLITRAEGVLVCEIVMVARADPGLSFWFVLFFSRVHHLPACPSYLYEHAA